MDFGGIERGGFLGGYEIVNCSCTSLPQDAATAMSSINSTLLGATFDPLWYVGSQLVNGTNYLFIAKELRVTAASKPMIVGLVVNVPPAPNQDDAKIVRIIERDSQMPPEAVTAFAQVEKSLVGVSYRPVLYIGQQVVKGMNYYIACEAKGIYPDAEPYPVIMCINVFQQCASIVTIEKI